jgi:ArsR family metal-binding transcriptional regulator
MEFSSSNAAGVRVFHAATIESPVDIYLNDQIVITQLNYSEASRYLPLNKGKYNIKIYESGTGNLLYNQTINIDGNKFITLSAISEAGKLDLIVVEDFMEPTHRYGDITELYQEANRIQPIVSGQSKIRLVHLSPNTPAVDLTLSNGTSLFVDTKYKQVTNYLPIASGERMFELRRTGTKQAILKTPNIVFDPGLTYTIYTIGMLNGTPQLEAIVLTDGLPI